MKQKNKETILTEHIQCEVLTSPGQMEAVKDEWEALFKRAPHLSIFQSYSFNYTWINCHLTHITAQMMVLIAREGDVVVGIAPFIVKKKWGSPLIEPIGGSEVAYYGLLYEKDRFDVIQAMAGYCSSQYPKGVVHFPYHASSAPDVYIFMAALSEKGWSSRSWVRNVSHLLSWKKGFKAYLLNHSKKARKNITYERNRLEKKGVTVKAFQKEEITPDLFDRLAIIQKRSWLFRRGQAVINRGFLRDHLLDLGKTGYLDLFLMEKEGKEMAYLINYKSQNRRYAVMTGFDEQYAHLSPGKYLWSKAIETILDDDGAEYDFLFGDAEYKRFWGNRTHHVIRSVSWRGFLGLLGSLFPHRLHGFITRNEALKKYARQMRSWLHLNKAGKK